MKFLFIALFIIAHGCFMYKYDNGSIKHNKVPLIVLILMSIVSVLLALHFNNDHITTFVFICVAINVFTFIKNVFK